MAPQAAVAENARLTLEAVVLRLIESIFVAVVPSSAFGLVPVE
jgi:hypothetical protein